MPSQQILPLPKLSKTLEEIRTELFTEIENVQDEYAAKGWLPQRLNLNKGVVRGILEQEAFMHFQLRALLQATLAQAFPLHSTGAWLDVHCNQLGIDRKQATKAQGTVLFKRAAGEILQRNIPIPAGRIVRTQPDGRGEVYRYTSTADVVLQSGELEVAVPVVSEEYGALANAGPEQICELVTPVSGIGAVINPASWLSSEAANEETDAELQRRYVLAWQAKAGVTAAAYKATALAVTGVSDVAVADQHPRGEGTIDIIVKGTAGLPTANLLMAVDAAIGEQIIINHDFKVLAPTPVPVSINFVLELLTGDPDALVLAAKNFLQAYFGGTDPDLKGIDIGEDVIRDRLASGLISLPGLKRICWTAPSEDIEVPANGLAMLEDLNVTYEWVTEK